MKLVFLLFCFIFTFSIACAQQHDPTRPIDYLTLDTTQDTSTPIDTLKVQSIITSNHRKNAVINGIAVNEGDKIKGFTILTIAPDAVTVLDGSGKRQILPFINSFWIKKNQSRSDNVKTVVSN